MGTLLSEVHYIQKRMHHVWALLAKLASSILTAVKDISCSLWCCSLVSVLCVFVIGLLLNSPQLSGALFLSGLCRGVPAHTGQNSS